MQQLKQHILMGMPQPNNKWKAEPIPCLALPLYSYFKCIWFSFCAWFSTQFVASTYACASDLRSKRMRQRKKREEKMNVTHTTICWNVWRIFSPINIQNALSVLFCDLLAHECWLLIVVDIFVYYSFIREKSIEILWCAALILWSQRLIRLEFFPSVWAFPWFSYPICMTNKEVRSTFYASLIMLNVLLNDVYLFLVKLHGSALPSSDQMQSNGLVIRKHTVNKTVHRFGSENNIKKQSPIISSSAFVLFKRKSAISQQLHSKPRKKNRRNSGPVFRRLINCFFVFVPFFFW